MQIGIYGLCADCEKELTFEQLQHDPSRQRCLVCENKYQKQRYNNYKL
jgi:RNA polymerase-binding transcription factor DksA